MRPEVRARIHAMLGTSSRRKGVTRGKYKTRKYAAKVDKMAYDPRKPRGMDLSPEMIARMDAQEAEFNRLRDLYHPYGMHGASGESPGSLRAPTRRPR